MFEFNKSTIKKLLASSLIFCSVLSISSHKALYSKVPNYKNIFSKSIFVGDSMTEGLDAYDLVNEKNVAAKIGITMIKAQNDSTIMKKISSLQPKNIFILFGDNDIEKTTKTSKFINEYKKLIHKVKNEAPKANIYVESILPKTATAEKKPPYVKNSQLEQFNKAIKAMTKKEHIKYINIRNILKSTKKDLHEEDGIHFKYEFYPLLLKYISQNVKGLE